MTHPMRMALLTDGQTWRQCCQAWRPEMERLIYRCHQEARTDLTTQVQRLDKSLFELRADMRAQHSALRKEVNALREDTRSQFHSKFHSNPICHHPTAYTRPSFSC